MKSFKLIFHKISLDITLKFVNVIPVIISIDLIK